MPQYSIGRLANGWYSFVAIPQGYLKIDSLRCMDDRTALKAAQKMQSDADFEIIDQKPEECIQCGGPTNGSKFCSESCMDARIAEFGK